MDFKASIDVVSSNQVAQIKQLSCLKVKLDRSEDLPFKRESRVI